MSELRSLIRSIATQYPSAPTGDLALYVAKATPEQDILGFYEEALRQFVAVVIAQDRNAALNKAFSSPTPARTNPVPTPGGHPSKKVKALAQTDWQKLLMETIPTESNSRKPLGDCTVDDLRFVSAKRRKHADTVVAQAEKYDAMADWMIRHGATTLREAPEMTS